LSGSGNGLLEILVSFPGVPRSGKDTAEFGPASIGVAKKAVDLGVARRKRQGFLKGFSSLLIITLHEVTSADELELV
jgi:hypothetical protein